MEEFQNGDDISATVDQEEIWYGRINQCLKVRVNGLCFLFAFVWWYETKHRSRWSHVVPTGFKLVSKSTDNRANNLPLTVMELRERVLVQHFCIRTCNRVPPCDNPLSCNCNIKCKLSSLCLLHNTLNCNLGHPQGQHESDVDTHHTSQ